MYRHLFLIAFCLSTLAAPAADTPTSADRRLADYFRNETAALSESCLADIRSRTDWETRRPELRRQLQEMLGLWPMPERTDLKPVITGRITNEQFTVEKICFQASPHLYCTANLYLPKNVSKPAPTVLYECGHWRLLTNNISYGNKAVYQSDGARFAINGYVCLVLDTLLAGEVQGTHTGTRDHGLWWWNSRGYTPAGVEAWFGIRALDYLCSRPEVDTNRIGITGHSGGGAYSWTITALDDRIKAAAPLAGMADAKSHIGDGVIDHHCDCNFFINIYRWDFPQLAALAAPRPLLIGGTDQDTLFHLDSTMRIYEKVRRIFDLYDAEKKLGLVIAPGPHDEVPELQLAVLRWFNRYLKGSEEPIDLVSKRFLTPEQARVFTSLPDDSINMKIADSFVPRATDENKTAAELRTALAGKVFAGWPADAPPLDLKEACSVTRDGLRLRAWDFTSEHDVRLRLYLLEPAGAAAGAVEIRVLDASGWTNWLSAFRGMAGGLHSDWSDSMSGELAGPNPPASPTALEQLRQQMSANKTALAFFAPRGIGLDAWTGADNVKALTKIRRRFMLLGQTLDGMRVWDIRRAIQAAHEIRDDGETTIRLNADGPMAVNALYAALFEPGVRALELSDLPASQTEGPDYLGVLKICDLPQVRAAVSETARVEVR